MSDLHDWLRDHRFFKRGKAEAMSDPIEDDLVTRLRALADCDARAGEPLGKCMREAADEIVRLTTALAEAEAERDRLREAAGAIIRAIDHACKGGGVVPWLRDEFEALVALTRPAAQPEGGE